MGPLRLLLIEDCEDDAALVTRALTKAGYDVTAIRVDTAEALCEALDESTWDLAIADYSMPSFSGTRALEIIREHSADLPFIFVSGTIGEDMAVAAMKTGAHDYIMKGNLARLAPAVERELREAAVRHERTRATERVEYLAYHDVLTDLPNRALLHDRLQQAILTSRRENEALALMTLDLDGFKEVNEALGHFAGDWVLQQVAGRLRGLLQDADTVARLGGDEFGMLLPATDAHQAVQAARKVLRALKQPLFIDGLPLVVRGSIGIAAFPAHGTEGHELVQNAESAMYVAKAHRNGYSVYSPDRSRKTDQRLALMTALSQGLDTEQFVLEYQPIIQIRSGAVVALEALLRWNHPRYGRLLPKDFIEVAEHAGLITALTTLTIDRALADWSPSGDSRHPLIAINVSPRSLHDAALATRLCEILLARCASPSALAVEITEDAIMSDPEQSTVCLNDLRDMGIRVIVDDFGTGYSSLSYLRRLPVDQLKIDQSFVMGMAAGEDEALVRSIIDLSHNLGLSVIAEGVETKEVLDRLRALGCDGAQGYLISRPASAAEMAAWMRRATVPPVPSSLLPNGQSPSGVSKPRR